MLDNEQKYCEYTIMQIFYKVIQVQPLMKEVFLSNTTP